MGQVVVWKRDLADEIRKSYKSKTLASIAGYNVSLALGDDILDVLEKEEDYRTPALMVEDALEVCEATCQKIVKLLKQLDAECDQQPPAFVRKQVSGVESEIDREVKKLEAALEKAPQARWDKWVATRSQYRTYKLVCAAKVVYGTVKAALSVAALASAVPTGGATLALGIVGSIRSATSLFETGAKLWAEAETIEKKVNVSVVKLTRIYQDVLGKHQKSHKGGAKEAGMVVLNTALNAGLAPTMGVLASDVKLWSNKLAGIDINATNKTKAATRLLADTEKLEALLKTCKAKDVAKLRSVLAKAQAALDGALDACTAESARVRTGRKSLAVIEDEVLPQLKASQPKWEAVFEMVFPRLVKLGLAFAGEGLVDAEKAINDLRKSQATVSEVTLALERLSET